MNLAIPRPDMECLGDWSGAMWGTNSGTLTAHLAHLGKTLGGEIEFEEPDAGQFRTHFSGQIAEDGKFSGTLHAFAGPPTFELPKAGALNGFVGPEGSYIEGEWSTDIGTSGKFVLFRTVPGRKIVPSQPPAPPVALPPVNVAIPPALVSKTVTLGSYRVDGQDLKRLAEIIRKGTRVAQPIFNATERGRSFIHVGFESLINDPHTPAIICDLIVSVNELVGQLGSHVVNLTFKKDQENTLFVADYDPTWVEGKTAEIIEVLRQNESRTTRFLRRYGSGVNSVIFLLLLGLLPSISSLGRRLEIVFFTFGLLFALLYSWRLAVNTKIFLREQKLTFFQKHSNVWPSLLSVVLGGMIAYLIAKYVRQ